VADFVSDGSWRAQLTDRPTTNDRFAKKERFRPREPEPAVELGGIELEPWRVGEDFLALAAAPADGLPVERASLVNADPLMTALGRPNREQTITVRQATPTTLQALELTNGATLAALLQRSAGALAAKPPAEIFRHALGRAPSPAEAALLAEFAGSPARAGGVEDLLWSLAMHPEFQLIR
jgi:hypothetical protein